MRFDEFNLFKKLEPAGFSIGVPQTSLGWKGPGIADVQKALTALGYNVGPTGIDGIRGKYTIAAIRKYQQDRGLKVDGDAGPETVTALNKDISANPDKFKSITKSSPSDIKQSPGSSGSTAIGATPDMDTLEMIKTFEGFVPTAYWDHKQWSIGYGSFAGTNRSKPDIAGPISKEQATKMLKDHVQQFSNNVERWNRVGKYNWNEGQKGALISFAYNLGSIDQLTDQGRRDNATIARKMLEYNKASGKIEPGLVNRRRVEQQKFIMHTPELQRRN
jgi:GH24 family phage-related lysozyme (muramidase)